MERGRIELAGEFVQAMAYPNEALAAGFGVLLSGPNGVGELAASSLSRRGREVAVSEAIAHLAALFPLPPPPLPLPMQARARRACWRFSLAWRVVTLWSTFLLRKSG